MDRRYRWVVALAVAALAFAAIVWFDLAILLQAQRQAAGSFDLSSYVLVAAFGIVAEASVVILMAGLAWWSRSIVVGVVFVAAGLASTLAPPLLFGYHDMPDWLNQALTNWLGLIHGPINAESVVGAALIPAGVIGIYRWLTTRQSASRPG